MSRITPVSRKELIRRAKCALHSAHDLNSMNPQVILVCESLERRRTVPNDLPYDLEEPGDESEIAKGLMKLSEQSLHDFLANEPDIYKDKDLKVRYR